MPKILYNEKYDIIIQAGQSNAEGSGYGDTTEPYELTPDICYMLDTRDSLSFGKEDVVIKAVDDSNSIEVANERPFQGRVYGDFSLTFAKDYVNSGRLQKGKKLLIIRAAVGGTSFEGGQWKVGDYLYQRMLALVDFALSLNKENKIVCFLWHQGESDAGTDSTVFYQRLTAMLQSVRTRYGEDIPFIAGDFVNEWKMRNIEDCEPIINKIKQVINENFPAAFVETSDLLSNNQQFGNGDPIHFSRDSLYRLGHRYFEAYSKL